MLTMATKKTTSVPKVISPFGSKEYNNEFYAASLVYIENSSETQSKRWLLEHVTSLNRNSEEYSSLPSKKYNPYGVYVKMQKDGILLPIGIQQSVDEFIEDLRKQHKNRADKREGIRSDKNKMDNKQIHNFLGDLNYFIDCQLQTIVTNKKPNTNITNILELYNISGSYHKMTKDLLARILHDIKLAKSKKDEQFVEAYSFMTQKQLTVYINFLEKLYANIESISSEVTTRKPRKIKTKKPEQLVKSIVLQESCAETGLKSKNKTELIGAQVVFVYNTTTRFLIRYESSEKISAKGHTLLNVDEILSGKKKIRKPSVFFKDINPLNRKYMERLWDSIKTKKASVKNRVNDTTILISCFS